MVWFCKMFQYIPTNITRNEIVIEYVSIQVILLVHFYAFQSKTFNNNNNNNNGHLLCAGIRPKTLMAQAIIITLSLSGNHQNHFAFLIRLFAANGQLLAQTYGHLDCDIPLNKYPIRLGRRSKRGKVICPGSQHVGRNGARTHNLPFMSIYIRIFTSLYFIFIFISYLSVSLYLVIIDTDMNIDIKKNWRSRHNFGASYFQKFRNDVKLTTCLERPDS